MICEITPDQFARMLNSAQRRAIRLETLPEYRVPEETHSIEAFMSGVPLPGPQDLDEEWFETVRSAVVRGCPIRRIRIIEPPLGIYLMFEIAWGYCYSYQHGEDIRLIPAQDLPCRYESLPGDLWLLDDSLIHIRYRENGEFEGFDQQDDPDQVAHAARLLEALLTHSVSLPEYLAKLRNGDRC